MSTNTERKYVGVRFYNDHSNELGPKTYIYCTALDHSEGDHVTVNVRGDVKVVLVTKVNRFTMAEKSLANKWIEGAVEKEEEAAKGKDNLEQAADVWAEMEKRVAHLHKYMVIKAMSKKDKKLRKLLKKFDKLYTL